MRSVRHMVWMLLALILTAAVAEAQTTRPAGGEGDSAGGPMVDTPPEGEGPKAAPAPEGPGAQPTTGERPAPKPRPPGRKRTFFETYGFIIIMLGGFFLLYMFMGRSRRKQEARRREMLAAIKKGDKVVTIGGIVGTVMDIRPDEVTVKVDETNNVRMRFARWSIRGIGQEAKAEHPEKARQQQQKK